VIYYGLSRLILDGYGLEIGLLSFQFVNQKPDEADTTIPIGATASGETAPIVEEACLAITPPNAESQFEEVLTALNHQSRRHGWFSTATMVLGSLLAIVVGTAILILLTTLMMDGKLPHVKIDFSPTAFGFTSVRGNKGTNTTLSGITPLILLAATSIFAALMKRERTRLVSEISAYENVRAVGPLISALFLRNKVARTQVARVLKRLLPKMRPEDKSLINKEQRLQLNLYLGRSAAALLPDDNELSLAILKAYPAIGDDSEITIVRRIAQGKGRSGRSAEVRLAAQEYLDEVIRRQEKLKEPQTLLRSAESLESGSQALLRPMEGSLERDGSALLRPAEDSTDL